MEIMIEWLLTNKEVLEGDEIKGALGLALCVLSQRGVKKTLATADLHICW